ncbi:GIY-YIG nuclease family protein [Tumidithrix helvetica PCC 7403]|uniref:GIY-YIG nuclease family protein n=1 Tax=Tumidithrix helvetica TaxID=3457545 RepID=UPI003CAFE9AE
MSITDSIPALAELPFLPYLDEAGGISADLAGKIGVYAIFDRDRTLQYVGISRDIAASLKLHMVRVPDRCHWVKVTTVTKPSRTVLGEMQATWLGDKVLTSEEQELWDQPLDCKKQMTEAEKQLLAEALNEGEQEKILKNVARRLEEGILTQLKARGIGFDVRFNPKLKSAGILDIK